MIERGQAGARYVARAALASACGKLASSRSDARRKSRMVADDEGEGKVMTDWGVYEFFFSEKRGVRLSVCLDPRNFGRKCHIRHCSTL